MAPDDNLKLFTASQLQENAHIQLHMFKQAFPHVPSILSQYSKHVQGLGNNVFNMARASTSFQKMKKIGLTSASVCVGSCWFELF